MKADASTASSRSDEAEVRAEQLRAHFAQIPAMAIAPTVGGLYTVWVLWDAVDNRYLVGGMSAVTLLSVLRLLVHHHYFSLPREQGGQTKWHAFAILTALLSGCIWGSAAPLLYPPRLPAYEAYLVVLLTLLPVVPVAALAAYMPAFYAYYFPCIGPFIVTLALQAGRAEHMAALLLLMMMGAMLTFARRYSQSLGEAIRLRLELDRKTQQLEAVVRHKSQFIAAAGHDLRQPVHAMGLFLASLRQRGARSDEEPFIEHLDASLRNLRSMLTNMLDISRLDAEVVGPQQEDFAVESLLHRLAAEHAPLAAQKRLQLRCRATPALVHSDPVLLERILRNLLANALRYTSHGGVALTCRAQGSCVRLQVWDTGIGIAASALPAIFDEFRQLGHHDGGEAGGLGLGLAIVQRMSLLLGHRIEVRSVPGRGSVFSLVLPRGAAAPAASVAPHPRVSDAPPRREMAPGWVLVIEDDAASAAGSAALLAQWGHRAAVCDSVEAALAALDGTQGEPQLLIVDFRLAAGRSGLDAVAPIQQRLARAVPVILVTGDTAPARIREAFDAGHVLLHKPVDPQRLRAVMAELAAAQTAG
jgi:signal transduction histidine kinase/CheY-like chemotaxis protein